MAAGRPSGGVYSLQGRFLSMPPQAAWKEELGAQPLNPARVHKEDTTRWHVIPAPSASYAGERG